MTAPPGVTTVLTAASAHARSAYACFPEGDITLDVPRHYPWFMGIAASFAMSILSRSEFQDEEAALACVEARLWPHGPSCPHCSVIGEATKLKGKSTRSGTYKCRACRKPSRSRSGRSSKPATSPCTCGCKRSTGCVPPRRASAATSFTAPLGGMLKTAWFMSHRIREAMRSGDLAPFGGNGGAVEADETFIGREPGKEVKRAYHYKMKVLSLVDRVSGQARSVVVDDLHSRPIEPILRENIAKEARLMTDEAGHYLNVGQEFAEHGMVKHGKGEYVREDIYTSRAEATSACSRAA